MKENYTTFINEEYKDNLSKYSKNNNYFTKYIFLDDYLNMNNQFIKKILFKGFFNLFTETNEDNTLEKIIIELKNQIK
jgi:hypothetical protein